MAKKGPGTAPLGHSPFGKESLEGPKVHHDYHGMDSSVPAKGSARAIPGSHWEMAYNMIPDNGSTPAGAFEPKCSDVRPTTHRKVNKEDH